MTARWTIPGVGTSHVLVLADLVTGVVAPTIAVLVEFQILSGVGAGIAIAVVGVVTRYLRSFNVKTPPTPDAYASLMAASEIASELGKNGLSVELAFLADKAREKQQVRDGAPSVPPRVKGDLVDVFGGGEDLRRRADAEEKAQDEMAEARRVREGAPKPESELFPKGKPLDPETPGEPKS